MVSEREISDAVGNAAYGRDGDKIGTVEHFFVDDRTGAPSWVAVSTGVLGGRTSIVPLQDATFAGDRLVVPVTRDAVRSAPDTGGSGHLSPEDEARLREHYGLDRSGGGTAPAGDGGTAEPAGDGGTAAPAVDSAPTVPVSRVPGPPTAEHPAPGDTATGEMPSPTGEMPATTEMPATAETAARRATDTAGGMVRSEEQLRTRTERVPAKRVRIVKYVVTEEVQITVPIRREEIRIEEVPLGDDDAATGSVADAGHLPEEIVLHAERPVVGVEVVPTERVRLRIETVRGQETVTRQVRREQVVVDQQPATPAGA